jgi:hypothetical protein
MASSAEAKIMSTDSDRRKMITITAEGIVWMAILGNVQLALWHPQNKGASAKVAKQFCDQVLGKLRFENVLTADEVAQIYRDEMKAQNE